MELSFVTGDIFSIKLSLCHSLVRSEHYSALSHELRAESKYRKLVDRS